LEIVKKLSYFVKNNPIAAMKQSH